MGFYHLMDSAVMHCTKRDVVLNSIWKVYSVLIEYCCKTSYEMIVRNNNCEHEDIVKDLETKFNEQLKRYEI